MAEWYVCHEASDVFTKLSSYPTHVEEEIYWEAGNVCCHDVWQIQFN